MKDYSTTPGSSSSGVRSGCIELSNDPLERSGCDMIAYGINHTGQLIGSTAQAIPVAAGTEARDAARARLACTDRGLGTVVVTPSFGLGPHAAPGMERRDVPEGTLLPPRSTYFPGIQPCPEGVSSFMLLAGDEWIASRSRSIILIVVVVSVTGVP